MTFLAVIVLAGLGLVLAWKALDLPREAVALVAAALTIGLAGYALQGSPDLPGRATPPRAAPPQGADVLIAARRAMFGGVVAPTRYVTMADGFARKGRTADAAGFLRLAVAENPSDAEAWVALGNMLVAHADGSLTPPAAEAFRRAAEAAPNNPAPAYFEGFAKLQAGEVPEAQALWAEALSKVPANAPYRPILAGQLARLEEMIGRVEAMRPDPAQPQIAPAT